MKRVSKEFVIKALETEPLQPGNFYSYRGNDQCTVCAVGAVLRKKLKGRVIEGEFDEMAHIVTKGAYVGDDVGELLERKNYMGALSNYFEAKAKEIGGDDYDDQTLTARDIRELRKKTIAFVKMHFPKTINLEI